MSIRVFILVLLRVFWRWLHVHRVFIGHASSHLFIRFPLVVSITLPRRSSHTAPPYPSPSILHPTHLIAYHLLPPSVSPILFHPPPRVWVVLPRCSFYLTNFLVESIPVSM